MNGPDVANGGGEGALNPSAMTTIACVVGEPDSINGANGIFEKFTAHFVRAEEGADAACK